MAKSTFRIPIPMQTIRRRMTDLLSKREYRACDLSRELGIKEKDVFDHLSHISRSVSANGQKLTIIPAGCISCGYVFKTRSRFAKPGRCPRCRSERISDPEYRIM